MPTPQRRREPALMDRVVAEPHRFQFVQLVHILLRHLRRQGIGYGQAMRDVLRFRNSLSLDFPATELEALEIEVASADSTDLTGELRRAAVTKVRITPSFTGLLGIGGALPLHDTERLAFRRAETGDDSQNALLDMFAHRLISLYYEAWSKHRVEHSLDARGTDRLLPLLMALAGVVHRGGVGERGAQVAGFYAGLIGTRPVAARTVERVVSEYFDVPVRLEQFVGCWDDIPENRRSTFGAAGPVLGAGAVLGTRTWRHDLRARLHIGPVDKSQMDAFLPGGSALLELARLTQLFGVPSVLYEVRLALSSLCVQPTTLTTKSTSARLGWTTFLIRTPGTALNPAVKLALESMQKDDTRTNRRAC